MFLYGVLELSLILFYNEVLGVFSISRSSLWIPRPAYLDRTGQDRVSLSRGIETGCQRPVIDPFDEEMTQLDGYLPKVVCEGMNWVQCNYSQCKVRKIILQTHVRVECVYQDLIYDTDDKAHFGKEVNIAGDAVYTLVESDHAKVSCVGLSENGTSYGFLSSKWSGYVIGFRKSVERKSPSPGQENTVNVLIFGFDSTSKNGFLRHMPYSVKVLLEELDAVILNAYNNVGDGTRRALFPILSGQEEIELTNITVKATKRPMDDLPWLFYKLSEDGFRTAYFEDSPATGTSQRRRLEGWRKQPTDYYSRHYFLQLNEVKKMDSYCVGDVPYYVQMMRITHDFLKLEGKKFCFTFVVEITHSVSNKIQVADDHFAAFLKGLRNDGQLDDTLLILMSGHGPRFGKERSTFSSELEEKQPLMAIVMPKKLKIVRPEAYVALKNNVNVLTTPHDIYATILDAVDMRDKWNLYKAPGATMTRGLTLFEKISENRSCSEAGVEPHWCTCFNWYKVSRLDPMFNKSAEIIIDHMNRMVAQNISFCTPRYLKSIDFVMKQQIDSSFLKLDTKKKSDFKVQHSSTETTKTRPNREDYFVKIKVGPGEGEYEAIVTYLRKGNIQFSSVNNRNIKRTNPYDDGGETSCIRKHYPHLNKLCYCKDYYERTVTNGVKDFHHFSYKTTRKMLKTSLKTSTPNIDNLTNKRMPDKLTSV